MLTGNGQQTVQKWLNEYDSLEAINTTDSWEQDLFAKIKQHSKNKQRPGIKLAAVIGCVLILNSLFFVAQRKPSSLQDNQRIEMLQHISEQLLVTSTASK